MHGKQPPFVATISQQCHHIQHITRSHFGLDRGMPSRNWKAFGPLRKDVKKRLKIERGLGAANEWMVRHLTCIAYQVAANTPEELSEAAEGNMPHWLDDRWVLAQKGKAMGEEPPCPVTPVAPELEDPVTPARSPKGSAGGPDSEQTKQGTGTGLLGRLL